MSYCPFFYQSYFISLFLDYDGLPKAHLIFHPKTREELKGSRRKNGVPYGVPIRILHHPMNDKKDELLRLCIFFAFQSHAYFRLLELQSHPNELKLALGESNKKVGGLWPFTTLKSFLEILQLFIRLFCDFVSEPGKASSKVIQTHLLPFS